MPDKAIEMYKMINPIEHTKTLEQAMKYKVEPYVIEADIYSLDNFAGRGGWTWYTGSSGWMYTLQTEYILGIKIKHERLKICPCVPKDWDKFEVKLKWKNAIYNIKYERKKIEKKESLNIVKEDDNNVEMILEGKKVEEIPLENNGNFYIIVKY